MIPPVVASDRGTAQTFAVATPHGGSRTAIEVRRERSGSVWKVAPQRVKAPYAQADVGRRHPE